MAESNPGHAVDSVSASSIARIECVLRGEGIVEDLKVEVSEDSLKGEHFMSVMYHIKGSGKTKDGLSVTIPFVAKASIQNDFWKRTFKTDHLFRKEMDFYNVILPAYIGFQVMNWRSHGELPDRDGLEYIPRCYCAVREVTEDIILMEDLMAAGFVMEKRTIGLDLDKSLLVMRSLGKLHAFSYSLQQKDPVTFRALTKLIPEVFFGIENEDHQGVSFQKNSLSAAASVKKRYPVIGEKLETKLKDGIFKIMSKVTNSRDRYSVINHGDTWINNMLFRRSGDGSGWEVKFVDYQMMRHCSPATDLSYFLMTSVERSTREQHFDDLLKEYHKTLIQNLKRFRCSDVDSILPFSQLEIEMQKYSIFGIAMALIFLPLYYVDPDTSPDVGHVETINHLTELHDLGMEIKETRENLESILKISYDRGYI